MQQLTFDEEKIQDDQVEDLLLEEAGLKEYQAISEVWDIGTSSKKLGYLTHNYFRYYGKFPPFVAAKFIQTYVEPGDLVVDTMVGSGTTLVESILSDNPAIGFDINPLSCLVSKVKTTSVDPQTLRKALSEIREEYDKVLARKDYQKLDSEIPREMRNIDHWFFEVSQKELAAIKIAIRKVCEDQKDVFDFFWVALGAIIRKVSRASNGQGRQFHDKREEPGDAFEAFAKKCSQMIDRMSELSLLKTEIKILNENAASTGLCSNSVDLSICHPPYFNSYRYSSIYLFELYWLDFLKSERGKEQTKIREIRNDEVREAFKMGKAEKVTEYIEDMAKVVQELYRITKPGHHAAVMLGDTVIKGQRIQTSKMLLDEALKAGFSLSRLIVRKPRFTEATYYTAQRRTTETLGITLTDFILDLEKPLES